jgi:hypothetical protein
MPVQASAHCFRFVVQLLPRRVGGWYMVVQLSLKAAPSEELQVTPSEEGQERLLQAG